MPRIEPSRTEQQQLDELAALRRAYEQASDEMTQSQRGSAAFEKAQLAYEEAFAKYEALKRKIKRERGIPLQPWEKE